MSDAGASDNRELLKRALRKLDELQGKLDATERERREPIAVVGLGCRFPRGGNDPAAFWHNLREGVDGITEIPSDRWPVETFYDPEPGVPGKMYVRHAGLLDQVDSFDPHFFGIAPREALGADPQQRLLLEVVWEALEDAGQAPDGLEGRATGVFVGIGTFDYTQLQTRAGGTDVIDAYSASGMAHSVASGRVSYALGLQGPSVAVDTACSSSLVAVHLACQSLRAGESEIALAGGVNLILAPDGSIATCQARMLAPDGRCKTFDEKADGYVRSEGCGIVVLKRLSAAIANRDQIRAVIRGTAINQDGRSSGLTAPNGPAQEAVIRQALELSGVEGSDVAYVEAHGTGTSLGDPIELRALGAVLGPGRAADRPLGVGSVKTNIGHLEAAAGIAGLVKMVLALENEEIPPHLHFHTPNPHVPWDGLPLEVVTERRPFPRRERPRLVGVSAFGFSGTNAHLVLEEAPAVSEEAIGVERPQHLLCLSGRDEKALQAQVASLEQSLREHPGTPWADVCFTAAAGRSHFQERLALRAATSGEGRKRLLAAMDGGEPDPGTWRGRAGDGSPEVAFLFTGQGSQHAGMGRQLYETQPTFRRALERCAVVLEGDLERPLLEVVFESSEEESVLGQTGYTQPALFAVEYALAELLRAWGIEPTIVLGHSVGEYVAACVAGVMGLEDGLRLIARRGRLMQSLPSGGAMTALEAPEDRVREALRGHEGEVSVAAVNAPDSVVISGVAEVVSEISRGLEAAGVRAQPLKVSHAFHSPLIEPILSDLESAAGEVEYGEARLGIVSNLSGKLAGPGDLARPGYWRRQAREAVRFAASIETLREEGIGAYVEVGPHPTLLGLAQRQVTDGQGSWHPTLRRGQEDWSTLLDAVGGLYVRGVEVDWEGFDRDYRRRRVSLPTYPFERRRYWLESASRGARNARVHGGGGGVVVHPLLGARVRSPLSVISYESELESGSPGYLSDHAFYGRVVFPAAGYAELGLAASREVFGAGAVRVEELEIEEPLLLESERGVLVQTLVTPEEGGSARFEVFSALTSEEEPTWRRHVRGRVGGGDGAGTSGEDSPVVSARERCGEEIPVERYYEEFREHGVEYGPGFRWLHRVWPGADEAVGELRRPEGVEGGVGGYLVHPGLLDGGIQLLGAALAGRGDSDSAYMPIRLSGLRWHSSSPTVSLAHVKVGEGSSEGALRAELSFSDEDGRVWLEVGEIELRRAPRSALERAAGDPVSGWLYGLEWREQALEDSAVTESEPGGWLVLDDGGEVGAQLSARLVEAGDRVMRVRPGDGTSDTCDPLDRDGFGKRLEALCGGANGEGRVPLRGVVHLWGLDGGDSGPEEVSAEAIESALQVSGGGLMTVVQALARREEGEAPRLYLVTRGAQSVGMPPSRLDLSAAPLWGLARTVALEHPGLRPVRIDLDPGDGSPEALWREVRSVGDEDQVALRDGKRYVARLGRASVPTSSPDEPVQLQVGQHGGLEGLDLVRIERRAPGAGEVEIGVEASGLNFRDVLNALGMYPGDAGPLGSECAGTVTRVGSGVEDLAEGDAVVALVAGAFASHATTRAAMVARLPEGMSAEEAAGVPIAYLTAQYAFEALAELKAGQKVLIHAAAGGVGMAAVHLARRAGAEIFGTAGNEEKRALLRELGVEHTLDSRSVSFAEEIVERTGGRGVDVVLNALSGEFIEKSLGLVAPGGCFVEIGKRGVWSEDRVKERFPGIRYHVFDLGEPLQDDLERVMGMLRDVLSALKEADLGGLPRTCFPLERARDAFRYMAQARHVGKIVLVRKAGARASAIREDGLYLVTGGLGGLGLEVAGWLVERGARHLALVSRRPPNEAAKASLEALERAGARVRVGQVDMSDPEAVGRFLAEARADGSPPLRGILHAAGVIDDGMLAQQDWSRFERVLAPKLRGALALVDHIRDQEIDFLVLFSSVASLLGSPGQGNYAMANAFLDALAHDLQARGGPALSINWGPWSRVGMAAGLDEADQRRRAAQGVDLLEPEEGCRALERLLDSSLVQCAVMPVDWSRFQRTLPEGAGRLFFEELTTTAKDGQAPQEKTHDELRRKIEAAPPRQRQQIVHEHVRQQVTRVLGLDPDHPPGPKDGLTALGMDSLMAVELKNRLEASLGISLPVAALLDQVTIEALAGVLLENLGQVQGAASTRPDPDDEDWARTGQLLERIEDMSEGEIDQLLGEMAREDRLE